MAPKEGGGKGGSKAKERRRQAKLLEQKMKDSKMHVEEAMKFHDKNNFSKAISQLTLAIEDNPENFEAYTWRGRCYRELKDFEKAIGDYTKAIELQPPEAHQMAMAHHGRGNAYDCGEQWDNAIEDYTAVIDLVPEDDQAYNCRGNSRQCKRITGLKLSNAEFTSVVRDFTKAIELNENNFFAYCNRGTAMYDRKRFKEAIEDYTTSIRIRHDYTYAYIRRGVSYYESIIFQEEQEKMKAEEAELLKQVNGETEEKGIPKGEKEQQALFETEFRSIEEAERKEKERQQLLELATNDFTKVISMDENDPTGYKHRAKVYDIIGNKEKADADRKKASDIEAKLAKGR